MGAGWKKFNSSQKAAINAARRARKKAKDEFGGKPDDVRDQVQRFASALLTKMNALLRSVELDASRRPTDGGLAQLKVIRELMTYSRDYIQMALGEPEGERPDKSEKPAGAGDSSAAIAAMREKRGEAS